MFDVEAFGEGSMKSFSFGSGKLQPAWWAFDFVANWMEVSYQNMSESYVYPRVQAVQREVTNAVQEAIRKVKRGPGTNSVGVYLGETQKKLQRSVTEKWWSFAEMLVVRYNDQFFNWGPNAPNTVAAIGYPAFWLEMIGYNQQSFYPTWFVPTGRDSIPALLPEEYRKQVAGPIDPLVTAARPVPAWSISELASFTPSTMAVIALLYGALVAALGYRLGRRHENQGSLRDYVQVA